MNEKEECWCGINPASTEEHTCPYKVKVNSDLKFKCNCCNECMKLCEEDVELLKGVEDDYDILNDQL